MDSKEFRGITGWLIVYIFMVAVDITLYLLALGQGIAYSTQFVLTYTFYLYLIEILFLSWALSVLFAKNHRAPAINNTVLVISVGIQIISYLYPDTIANTTHYLPSKSTFSLIISILISLLWIMYWNKSRRVQRLFSEF